MSAYIINFSEPLKAGFSIPAGGFNGPGGSSSNTSLRLYGRGALEWGESVDEDLVRLAENFASASSPSSPIAGQTWVERSLYYHDSTAAPLEGWYYYDLNETILVNKWKFVNTTGEVSAIPALTPTEGTYYLSTETDPNDPDYREGPGLYGFYSLGRYEPAAWRKRSSFEGAGAPDETIVPPQYVRVYNTVTTEWSTPTPVNISSGVAPTSPFVGMLWYDPATGILSVYASDLTWQNIFGPSNGTTLVAYSDIDMDGFNITGLTNGAYSYPSVDPTEVATHGQLDTVFNTAGNGKFLLLTGGTLTGGLTINSTLGVSGATTFANTTSHTGNATFTTLSSSGTATLNAANVTNGLTVGTSLSVGGNTTLTGTLQVGTTMTVNASLITVTNKRITGVASPSVGSDATNKTYVDAQIASAVVGALTASQVSLANPTGSPKDGDIRTFAPNIVEIYSNGGWRRVFPAQWAA